ncbi:mucin-5AC [Cucurbita moschata]|uniref:Mucin-5AC n=1 Tax=Cucurbita moschata TaxID=3662 RepID=A0A6J1GEV2_CUCMO|nr:mucin-5AC [Cucurbita moschata]XP_022950140.1 mucin-5AC [Cucurbita moschata]
MNRNWRESLSGGRNAPLLSQHRRGHSFTGISRDSDENLDLFSKNRRSLSVAASDGSTDATVKLGRLSVGSVKLAKSGIDDLLSSTEGGKHDYDWLLTPPGTPLFPSSSESEVQSTVAAPRNSSLVRSSSTTKASRLSVSQPESNNPSRSARSSSVSRSSVSTPQYSSYSSNRSSSILNTSSASVSSYIRPASPSTRSASTARPSTPSSRSTPSRSSTPSRARPSPTSSSIDKPRQLQSSRPSTPNSRPQIPANLSSPAARSNSRPSTPTRRNSAPSLSSVVSTPSSTSRVLSTNGRSSTSTSRPSSPSPRVRAAPQPIVLPDFPLDTPPNLRTTLPDRPISAGRSRPTPTSVRGSPETTPTVTMPRRASSPTVSRGRLTDAPGRGRVNTNGHLSDSPETRRLSSSSDLGGRRPVKPSTTTAESNGFGRSISKKSLDVAIRNMDIRNSPGNVRSGSGSTLFPHSIRAAASPKTQSIASSNPEAIDTDFQMSINNNMERGNHFHRHSATMGTEGGENGRFCASLNHLDIYESSRYDAILLKEDLKNTNWLHSADDKTDLGSILDNGFEALPEPFGLL